MGMGKRKRPLGLTRNDTLEDALGRAKQLSGEDWHSGQLCDKKNLRRIVLMADEINYLQEENNKLKQAIKDVKSVTKLDYIPALLELRLKDLFGFIE